MKTSREDILFTALKLFAQKGYDAVSTSMIAEELGITKGALYRHFENKQSIFDWIVQKMFELDAQQAQENHVPEKEYECEQTAYKETSFFDLCAFVNEQYLFWTENEFACQFRRLITIEQYKSEVRSRMYQDVIAQGPVQYTEDLFREMLLSGQLSKEAQAMGAHNLALMLFAPLTLSLQLFDGGEDTLLIQDNLRMITKDFEDRWVRRKETKWEQ